MTRPYFIDLQLFAQEKTEDATPKKRDEARKRGEVFKSTEVVSAITLLTSYLLLRFAVPWVGQNVMAFSRTLWAQGPLQDWSEPGVRLLVVQAMLLVAAVTAPLFIGVMIAGVAGNLLQVGFLFTGKPLVPKFERINPLAGFKRLFSKRSLMELFKSLFKISVVAGVAYGTVASDLTHFPKLMGMEVLQAMQFLGGLVLDLFLWVGVAMLVLAALDFFYQRWEYNDNLKMTKQEVKEEHKQTDGNPEIRAKIKQKQRELARQRMMSDVAKADVVVTNPTHFAVALSYQADAMGAPKVLAKGQGFVALRIREIASEAGVPIVENPPLARALYRVTDIGTEVPADMYQAVAELLAYVYQLKQKGY